MAKQIAEQNLKGIAAIASKGAAQLYNLEVLVIPTHRPIVRDDRNDLIYKTTREKYNAFCKKRDEDEKAQRIAESQSN